MYRVITRGDVSLPLRSKFLLNVTLTLSDAGTEGSISHCAYNVVSYAVFVPAISFSASLSVAWSIFVVESTVTPLPSAFVFQPLNT